MMASRSENDLSFNYKKYEWANTLQIFKIFLPSTLSKIGKFQNKLQLGRQFAIDESMIKFKGRSSLKSKKAITNLICIPGNLLPK